MSTLSALLRGRAHSLGGGRMHGGRRFGLLRRALERLMLWQSRAAERTALAELDERLLRDMGLSRRDVERESRKPFWLP